MRQRLDRSDPVDYQVTRSNRGWVDHQLRASVTAAMIAWMTPESVLDPACGDGSIVVEANNLYTLRSVSLSDISRPSIEALALITPPHWELGVADLWDSIGGSGEFSLIVLTEILEHVPDPVAVLRHAKKHAGVLVASSPVMRDGQVDPNPEHLWMFDEQGYRDLLKEGGWRLFQETVLRFPPWMGGVYDFGVMVAKH